MAHKWLGLDKSGISGYCPVNEVRDRSEEIGLRGTGREKAYFSLYVGVYCVRTINYMVIRETK